LRPAEYQNTGHSCLTWINAGGSTISHAAPDRWRWGTRAMPVLNSNMISPGSGLRSGIHGGRIALNQSRTAVKGVIFDMDSGGKAFTWLSDDDQIGTELEHRPRGAAAQVLEILEREAPEADEPR
jgi:hypothetical protein